MKKPVILLIGTFDTKGDIFSYLYHHLNTPDWDVLAINTGTFTTNIDFPIEFGSDVVATLGGKSLQRLHENQIRHQAVEVMSSGAARICSELIRTRKVIGAIGAGGGGGTYMTLKAFQEIPIGIPKICISTLASKDLSGQMGTRDVMLVPSIVDVAHLNSIIQPILLQSVAALKGMASEFLNRQTSVQARHKVAISMFGNTTPCVEQCTKLLDENNCEVFTFHSTGNGGRIMEALIAEDQFDGVIDVTTTELADYLCGGVCDAGPGRLENAVANDIPQVVVPGCLDMVNFTFPDQVPEQYRGRNLYQWSPDVTLMRTNEEENEQLGILIAQKINKTRVPVSVVIPLQGLSAIDREGSGFYDARANQSLFQAIRQHLDNDLIQYFELDLHINDLKFSQELVKYYFRLFESFEKPNQRNIS